MTRMLTGLGAVLILIVASAQAATAKQVVGTWNGGAQASTPRSGQSGAPAPGAVTEVSSTATASGNASTATATATCPGGTKAAGGGFYAPSSADVIALVYESVKVHQKAWRASVQLLDQDGDPTPLTLTTYVYCRSHFPATKAVAATVPTNGHLQLGPTAEATCPSGRVAVAGGFRMPAPLTGPTVTDLFFDSLRSGDTSWDARVVTGPAGPSSFTSEAYCARRISAPAEVTASSAPNGVDSTPSTAAATCPAGTSPAAGGFAQPDSVVFSFFVVDGSRRVGDAWEVSAWHTGAQPAVALQAAGYCA